MGGINWKWFALLQASGVILGTVMESRIIWDFSELANGLMAVPNLITLLLLSGTVANLGLDSREKI